ncbi:hypothetical protein ACT7DE_17795 [Bacillus paranthracis]
MLANNKGDELLKIQEKMESKSPYVDFEVAYINKDWKKVVELKDEVDLNGRREKTDCRSVYVSEEIQRS